MISKKLTHIQEMLANLLQQFKDKPRIKGFLTAFGRQVQDLENAFFEIAVITNLDSATGVQLDVLGALIGQLRNGMADTLYRRFIRARVLVNVSTGTVQEIIAVIKVLIPTATISFVEAEPDDAPSNEPACFIVDIVGDIDDSISGYPEMAMALLARSPGIKANFSYRHAKHFKLDTAGIGFDATGGKLSTTVGA